MARIDERRKILEAKLKEMSEDGVMKGKPKDTLAFDPPDEDEENEQQEAKEIMPVCRPWKRNMDWINPCFSSYLFT